MTCMTLTLLGNYSQTGHFGGPLAYTPYNVAIHLAGPEAGGFATITAGPSTLTPTNSCWPPAIAPPPATPSG